jgi:uncharacterized protein
MKSGVVILFLRYPERGKVKTRLAQDIGDDLAYDLYVCFIRDALGAVRDVDADLIIVGTGSTGKGPAGIFGRSVRLLQHGRDLGARMYHAFADVFSRGYSRAIMIGSDCPGLPAGYISQALLELESHDVVLGPTRDGGYYLIAFKEDSLREDIFHGIVWSTSRVFVETMSRIEDAALSVSILPQWEDIDELDDLRRFADDRERAGSAVHTLKFIDQNREKLYGET